MDPHHLIPLAWLLWAGAWLAAARLRRTPLRREAPRSRLVHIALLAATFGLLFVDGLGVGLLGQQLLPPGSFTLIVGLASVCAGLAFSWWARLHLGRHWSGAIALHPEHDLIRTGPYAVVRHPIYAGVLLAIVGTALALGEIRACVAVAIGWFAYRRKAGVEEQWLAERFGAVHADYRRSVPSGLGPRSLAIRRRSPPGTNR